MIEFVDGYGRPWPPQPPETLYKWVDPYKVAEVLRGLRYQQEIIDVLEGPDKDKALRHNAKIEAAAAHLGVNL